MTIHFHRPIHTAGLFSKLIKEVVTVHDWLTGPGMSEQERMERELFETEGWRRATTGL